MATLLQCYSWRTIELDIVNTDWVIYSRICMALEVPRQRPVAGPLEGLVRRSV